MDLKSSDKYETLKRFYLSRFWNETQLRNAVQKGWITSAEFRTIVGKGY